MADIKQITTIKFKGNKTIISYYTVTDEMRDNVTLSSNRPPHKDFTDKMAKLRVHVINFGDLNQSITTSKIIVTGFNVTPGENDEESGVVIYAETKRTSAARALKVETKTIPLSKPDIYKDGEKLDKICSSIIAEAWEYIGGKIKEEDQIKIDFGQDKVGMKVEAVEVQSNTKDEDTLPF